MIHKEQLWFMRIGWRKILMDFDSRDWDVEVIDELLRKMERVVTRSQNDLP